MRTFLDAEPCSVLTGVPVRNRFVPVFFEDCGVRLELQGRFAPKTVVMLDCVSGLEERSA